MTLNEAMDIIDRNRCGFEVRYIPKVRYNRWSRCATIEEAEKELEYFKKMENTAKAKIIKIKGNFVRANPDQTKLKQDYYFTIEVIEKPKSVNGKFRAHVTYGDSSTQSWSDKYSVLANTYEEAVIKLAKQLKGENNE